MLFKIYADFKWNGKRVRGSDRYHNIHMLKNIRNIFLAALPITLFVVMINLLNQLFLTGKKCNQH